MLYNKDQLFVNIDAYLTEKQINHFVNFSGDWMEPGHFSYMDVDVLFFV